MFLISRVLALNLPYIKLCIERYKLKQTTFLSILIYQVYVYDDGATQSL